MSKVDQTPHPADDASRGSSPLRKLVQLFPEPALLVRGGRILLANRAAAELSGLRADALRGAALAELICGDPGKAARYLELCSRSHQPIPGAFRWRPSGVEFRCDGAVLRPRSSDRGNAVLLLRCRAKTQAHDRFLVLNQKIADLSREVLQRKRTQAMLGESQARMRALFENARDAILMFDDAARCVDANPAASDLTGYPRAELFLRGLDELIPPLFAATPTLWDHFRASGAHETESQLHCRDGTRIEIDLRATASILPGLHMAVLRDITRRKRDEEALRHAKQAAEAANSAKDELLAVLSHELRTPLTPVLAAAAMLERDTALPDQARADIEMIRRNVELEVHLIDDLLDLTRITRGKVRLQRDPIDLGTAFRQAIQICSQEFDAKELRLIPEFSGRLIVRGDSSRLQQVFWNLLKNAAKFTPARGTVTVRCFPDPSTSSAVAEVIDTGIGIEPSALGRIFDPFEQGTRGVTRQFGGLGLGLAICKSLVEMHGGRITASSAGRGQGATFRVELPLAAELSAPRRAPGEAAPSGTTAGSAAVAVPAGSGPHNERRLQPAASPRDNAPRILLVEDHPDTAQLMGRLLRIRGYDVRTAGTISAAVNLAQREKFDLLLSDLGLPDGTGLELMRRLLAEGIRIKGIALSGYGMDEDISRSRDAGFAEHLTKPVDFNLLHDVIARMVSGD